MVGAVILLAAAVCCGQDATIIITGGQKPGIALPDFRGAESAAPLMQTFNTTLASEVESSGLFRFVPKSLYPLRTPQQPSELRPTEWSAQPVGAAYVAFEYGAAQGGQLVISAWLFDTRQSDASTAQLIGKRYFGLLTENGVRRLAMEFAADIISLLGGVPLLGTRIYFVSNRTGTKEIWTMEPDGSDQRQLTRHRSITMLPAISADGTKLAYLTYAGFYPRLRVIDMESGRTLRFDNPDASLVASPHFLPDGRILFTHSQTGWSNLYIAGADGSAAQPVSPSRRIETEGKVNPKTGSDLVFVSGASGQAAQIWRMGLDGTNREQLTSGRGAAVNPAWHPGGAVIAFASTGGLAPGNFNIFVMDVATRRVDQLTHGAGRNEHPSWAPDGRRIVFSSTRGGRSQIFTMLADGTNLRQLTSEGTNEAPVWGK